ncbi:hypothetical protein ACQ3I4_02030 [Zafaria sp. Z1313]|uniref:hypothetical protein n=1 Tax=unclassified Zafaria TaxID=2828765 RepID=UPI002E76E39C|nr:hypothetical protein [Zafaria sp. J156]MEE1620152.1 hypothetical protein [Zafaria sp. J156]
MPRDAPGRAPTGPGPPGVLEALLGEASARGLDGVWLQVRESNVGAIVLYHALGFTTVSSYYYLTRSL